MILNDTDKMLMVMRPYQVYAVEALVRQATLTNRNAYVWHTTGAGKTLTSFKTAQILAANPNIKKVIFLVDRKDLDSQTTEEFNKFENGSVDATDRTDVLVKQMQDKNRQLIVTTMQKMANAVKRPQYAKIMDAYKDEKVVFIIRALSCLRKTIHHDLCILRALDSIRHFLHGGYNKLPVFVLHLLHKDIGAVSGIYRAIFKLIKLFRGLRVQILAVNEEDYLFNVWIGCENLRCLEGSQRFSRAGCMPDIGIAVGQCSLA